MSNSPQYGHVELERTDASRGSATPGPPRSDREMPSSARMAREQTLLSSLRLECVWTTFGDPGPPLTGLAQGENASWPTRINNGVRNRIDARAVPLFILEMVQHLVTPLQTVDISPPPPPVVTYCVRSCPPTTLCCRQHRQAVSRLRASVPQRSRTAALLPTTPPSAESWSVPVPPRVFLAPN